MYLIWFSLTILFYHAMIAQIFNPTAELVIPTGTSTNQAKAEIETHPLTAETKIIKCSK